MFRRNDKYEWNSEEEWRERSRDDSSGKETSLWRKAAAITAGAILFGVVAGAVMVGVNLTASNFLQERLAAAEAPEMETTTPQMQAPQEQPGAPAAPGGRASEPKTYIGAPADVSDIVEQAMPSVVAITSTALYQTRDFGYNWFFGGGGLTYEVPSSGSGIIVGENETELLIVTNNHVVEDTTSLKVTFIDDETVDAAIKGTDADTDLAVISVPLDSIPVATREAIKIAALGDSDQLKVGQMVIAIGNALGYGQSVTVGYISAVNREVQVSQNTTRMLLQTDAAINPGNSGGALVNMNGEVIGINAAKYSSTDVEGIGYAIPISSAQEIMGQLMTRKTRKPVEEEKRGYLGIQGTSVTEDAARTFGMPKGAYIYKILENGAAAGTGLREKDIVTAIDGQMVRDMTELQDLLAYYEAGDEVELTIQRQENGAYVESKVVVTLKPLPEEAAGATGRREQ